MLLFQQRMRLLEGLKLRDLTCGTGRWRLPRPPAQSTVPHILTPLREHEGMNQERSSHALHLATPAAD
ncbi:MAG TPA: hypothetical protein VII30_08390 [Gemmatimonadaceae bacterium]